MGDAYIEFASDAKGVSVEVRFRNALVCFSHALYTLPLCPSWP